MWTICNGERWKIEVLSSTIQGKVSLEHRLSDLEFVSLGETVARKNRDGKPRLEAMVRYGTEAQQTNGSRLR